MPKLKAVYNKAPFEFEYEKENNVDWEGGTISGPGGSIKEVSESPVSRYVVKIEDPLVFEGEKVFNRNAKSWLTPIVFPYDDLDKIITGEIDRFESEIK